MGNYRGWSRITNTVTLALDHLELCDVTRRIDLVEGLRLAPERTDVLLRPTGIDHRQVGTLTSSPMLALVRWPPIMQPSARSELWPARRYRKAKNWNIVQFESRFWWDLQSQQKNEYKIEAHTSFDSCHKTLCYHLLWVEKIVTFFCTLGGS